ncbi:CDP-glycerol glycerophosphotransferase family protein [Psychromonas antarctica]|uniref:CDP-glycerol glycerophosphotransferase family protein n=1 Tax=Psychromonas antarctica TaxID=67573 RepID=UPI001EE98C2E|nr:CDP-glycerol glycerophosphotransferase family protein [Psychromonas antarctica]MCG6201408.1 CDP-glycerol glycerophosphotransferase family protein [Psychromonas antarctica]
MQPKRYLMYISQNYSYAVLRPIQKEALRQGAEVAWFLEGREVNEQYLKEDESRLKTVDDIINWQPDAVFVPGNVVPNFIPGIKVGVFHGFDAGKINRKGIEDHYVIRNCFDLYCTQGPHTTKRFQSLAIKHKTFSVAETGWPSIDPLFTAIKNNPYIDKRDSRKTVLMCSTFSRNLSCAPIVFDKIKELSKSGKWRWLIQFHPKMDKIIVDQYKSLQNDNLQFVETDDVLPLLQAADVMLCDTSSVLIMYLLLRMPVVTFNNQTKNNSLLNIEQIDEIESAIDYALTYPAVLMQKIEAYCQKTHPYHDGKSSKRVIEVTDKLLVDGLSPVIKKPFNFIRQLKLRKKLNYWKW